MEQNAVTSSAVKSGRTTQLRSSGQESVAAKQEERRGEEAASSRRWHVNTWTKFFWREALFFVCHILVDVLFMPWPQHIYLLYLPSLTHNVSICPQAPAEKRLLGWWLILDTLQKLYMNYIHWALLEVLNLTRGRR